MTARIQVHAHDSGDGATVAHCPFCGGGQVVGRSDGTIECQFCAAAFTVQVQPMYSGFPQTVGGAPFPIPGMPGQVGGPPMPAGPMDPDMPPPPGEEAEDDGNPFADDADASGEDSMPPPKGKKESLLLHTASGARLSEAAFTEYVAVRHASDVERAELLERLRTSRGRL